MRATPSFASRDEVNIIIHGTVPYYNERVLQACPVASGASRRTTATYAGLLDAEIRGAVASGRGRGRGLEDAARYADVAGKGDTTKSNYLP